MEYGVIYQIHNLQIPAAQSEAALAAINALFVPEEIDQEGSAFYDDEEIETICQCYLGATPPQESTGYPTLIVALQAWSFSITVQPDDGVAIVSFHRNKARDEAVLFDAIAPFLDMSLRPRIDAYQENLEYWRYCFEEGVHRVLQFAATEAPQLHSYQLLKQVFDEQCAWNGAEGEPTIRIKTPDEIPCDSIDSPADPDSSYNKRRGHGYSVQIMETYVEDDAAAGFCEDAPDVPDLILHVAVGKLTAHGSTALEPAIVDVRERRLCPTQVLGDSHYGSQEQVEQMNTQSIQLIYLPCRPRGTNKDKSRWNNFLSWMHRAQLSLVPRDTHPMSAVLAIRRLKCDLTSTLAQIVPCMNSAMVISVHSQENVSNIRRNGSLLALAVWQINSRNLRNAIGGGLGLRERCLG